MAFVLAFALALSCISCFDFMGGEKAKAAGSSVSLEYDSSNGYWVVSSEACTIINSGAFEISIVASEGASGGWLYMELKDSTVSPTKYWCVKDYGITSAGTYTITQDFAYFQTTTDWSNYTTGLTYAGAATWGKIEAGGCTIYSITVSSSSEPHNSTIDVEAISGLSDDFICGMDVSSYLSEKNSGVKYYDYAGNELDDAGFFSFLKECGTTCVRIRVWVDPYDASGNTYGGGNCDLDNAKEIGKLATDAGLDVLIDFHYSDFWSDPERQYVPKDWEGKTVSQKASAISTYTTESLTALRNAGVDIGMVQIGNETTGKFCGETNWSNINQLFSAASSAIRTFDSNIQIVLHFANLQKSGYVAGYAQQVQNVDYDVFAVSYYPYWHGTISNMTSILSNIASTYNKKVMVAEVAYIYTTENGDSEANNSSTTFYGYPASVQGQASLLRDVCNAISSINNGIGVFYWEPAWIPVTYYDKTDAAYNEALNAWNTYGSGWATINAADYDENVEEYGKSGGTTVDNSALFNFFGYPLDSLETYKYLKSGHTATTDTVITSVDISYVYGCQTSVVMPTSVTANLSDGSTASLTPTWNATEVAAAASNNDYGRRTIHGTVSYGDQNYLCVAILYYWGESSDQPSGDEDEGYYWEGTVNFVTGTGYSTCTETSSNGLSLTMDTWALWVVVDSDAATAIAAMNEPKMELTRSGGNAKIWGFGIADTDWSWKAGSRDTETTDTTYTIDYDTSSYYLVNDRDWSDNTLKVRIYDANPSQTVTGNGYLEITEDIAGYVGDITITVNYTGNSSWEKSWFNLNYYDKSSDSNLTLDNTSGLASGTGTITFTVSAENLAKLQSSSYVEIKASYDNENAKYTGFVNSVTVSGLKPYVLYEQYAEQSSSTYAKRWIYLISEEEISTIDYAELTLTRSSKSDESITGSKTIKITKCFRSVSVSGEVITAPEGYRFLAYAMTDIPNGIDIAGEIELF